MSPTADRARTRTAARGPAMRGFTLVELLVALAIFAVIMGSLGMLLSGTINTTNQGYAMMNAMERARGSMAVLEQDLKTAFASTQRSRFFQFYGEPNGFTYLGQLASGGFGRVTYVVHADNANPPMQGTGGYETITLPLPWIDVATQFARMLCPKNPETGVGTNIDKNDDGVQDVFIAGIDAIPTQGELNNWKTASPLTGFQQYAVRVFGQINGGVPADPTAPVDFDLRIRRGVLLRYEENGQGSMTEFSSPLMQQIFTYQQALAPTDQYPGIPYPFGRLGDPDGALSIFPATQAETINRLQQNHYWVRMLSGYLPTANTVDPFTVNGMAAPPVFWTEDGGDPWPTQPGPAPVANHWRDHVVVEGILISAELLVPGTDTVIVAQDNVNLDINGQPTPVSINALDLSAFFKYGIENGTNGPTFNTFWDMPSVPVPGAASPEKHGFNYFLFGPNAAPQTGYYALDLNLACESLSEAMRAQTFQYSMGDPLRPRLPAWVAPGFWIFGDAPRVGGLPFHEWFQQKVDIPSGYLREGTGA